MNEALESRRFIKPVDLERGRKYRIMAVEKSKAYKSNVDYQINVLLETGFLMSLRKSTDALQKNPELLELMQEDLRKREHFIVVNGGDKPEGLSINIVHDEM